MPEIRMTLFNYQMGGLQTSGLYDFEPLCETAAGCVREPDLLVMNEANQYGRNGDAGVLGAADSLSDRFGVPYVGLMADVGRGELWTALFYNPNRLGLMRWWDGDRLQRGHGNYARAVFVDRDTDHTFTVVPVHLHAKSWEARVIEAKEVGKAAKLPGPVFLMGDFNESPSGPHLPQCNWMHMSYIDRMDKGRQDDKGEWGPQTAAMDHLLGPWHEELNGRGEGCGFYTAAEVALRAGVPADVCMVATVNNDVDLGGGLLVDHIMGTNPWVLKPETYRVHIPDPGRKPASDHRLVELAIDLSRT